MIDLSVQSVERDGLRHVGMGNASSIPPLQSGATINACPIESNRDIIKKPHHFSRGRLVHRLPIGTSRQWAAVSIRNCSTYCLFL
jgi:hypothetical protein